MGTLDRSDGVSLLRRVRDYRSHSLYKEECHFSFGRSPLMVLGYSTETNTDVWVGVWWSRKSSDRNDYRGSDLGPMDRGKHEV